VEVKQDVQHTEGSLKGKGKDTQNYCAQNVAQAIKLVPHEPKRNYVDTKKGDAHALQSSGLEPHYVLRKVYYTLATEEYALSNLMQFNNVTMYQTQSFNSATRKALY